MLATKTATPQPSGIEYVVVVDGIYSSPFESYQEAFNFSNSNGGQVRSRAKIS